jgi:hypothetical protein
MRLALFLALFVVVCPAASGFSQSSSKASRAAASNSHLHRHHRATRHVSISPERAKEIQQALVKAGYMHSVSGHWDSTSIEAMRRYQAAHHWQTRHVPDSRALIALGLGPHYDHLANAAAQSGEAADNASQSPDASADSGSPQQTSSPSVDAPPAAPPQRN